MNIIPMPLGINKVNKEKVLVVDQDVDVLQSLKEIEEFDICHECNKNHKSTLSTIKKHNHKVVILELDNGMSTLKKIKKYDPTIQVIVVTNFVNLSILEEAAKNGAIFLLTKPFVELAEVKDAINYCLVKIRHWDKIKSITVSVN